MNRPLLIGITGGIGAGKSVIARVFEILGVPVYDADSRAKELMAESESLKSAIKVLFGEQSFKDGAINRKHIASKAFQNPKLLAQLNELIHPRVKEDFENWSNDQKNPYVLKEAALLFETGSYRQLDQVILVTASESTRLKRVSKRDSHRSEDDIRAIMSRQWSDEKKVKMAHHVLNNDNSALVLPEVMRLHEGFMTSH